MKPGPKQETWLTLLETTDLPQGRFELFNRNKYEPSKNGFCCLGIAALSLGKEPDDITGGTLEEWEWEGLGLASDSGTATKQGFTSCTTMNDSEFKTFKEIASVLRQNFDVYFTRSV